MTCWLLAKESGSYNLDITERWLQLLFFQRFDSRVIYLVPGLRLFAMGLVRQGIGQVRFYPRLVEIY
jgi:hypothetical protein